MVGLLLDAPPPLRLRLLRQELGVGSRELSRRCGFSETRVCEIETGQRAPQPSFRRRVSEELAPDLDLDPDALAAVLWPWASLPGAGRRG